MKNWKAIAGVIAIFLLGALAGGLVVGGVVARRVHRYRTGQPVFTADEVTHFLKRRLDLDASQQQAVQLIVVEAQGQMREVRRSSEVQVGNVISNAVAQIQPVLHADQREKLARLVAERLSARR